MRTHLGIPAPQSKRTNGNAKPGAGAPAAAGGRRVWILDDDPESRRTTGRLLAGHGFEVRLLAGSDELLSASPPAQPACLVIDDHLAGTRSGLQVHAEMLRRGWSLPTLFLTAEWSVPTVVQAMRAGAAGFLTKPCPPAALVREVERATRIAPPPPQPPVTGDLARRAAELTPRERRIVAMVAAGCLNKEIAVELGLAEVTVKTQRRRAMRKLGAQSAAELGQLASRAGIC